MKRINFSKRIASFVFSIMAVLLATSLLLLSFPVPSSSEEIYKFERMWPTLQQPWYFSHTVGIAISKSNYIYVADFSFNRIQKLNANGQLVAMWETPWPTGIALDDDGFVYVAGWDSVRKFTSDGKLISTWGEYGTGDGQFHLAEGIALDSSGYVYIVDKFNNRVQKFTSDGRFVSKWGGYGSADGQFDLSANDGFYGNRIVIDSSGYIYIVDRGNNRIQKFTREGIFISKWSSQEWGFGGVGKLMGIALDKNGDILVAELQTGVFKFSSNGEFIDTVINTRSGELNEFLSSIAQDNDGYLYLTGGGRISKYTSMGQFVVAWKGYGNEQGYFLYPMGVATDSNGNIFVADTGNRRIQQFTSDGQFVTKWGSYGAGDGNFDEPYGIAVDNNSGFIYIADTQNGRIQKFTTDGQFITKWGSKGISDGEFQWPCGVAVDSNGFVYIADTDNSRIQKFTADGQFVSKWGGGDGEFNSPYGIAVDNSGFLYVADTFNDRVQKFTTNGIFITKWGAGRYPFGIAVDEHGYVYVAEGEGSRTIEKFDANGALVAKWGDLGSGAGAFGPQFIGISAGKNGLIYAADTSNNRMQVFRKVTTSNKAKAIIVSGGGPFPGNDLWDATQMSANFAYRTLTYQGYTKEKIHYLTSSNIDLDGNGVLDEVAGDAANANLQDSILNWAKDADDVLVYLVDHGGNGSFRMSGNETLTASQLSSWLDTLQNSTTGKVIIIYDACESGSFVSALRAPPDKQRIVISSTSPGESAYFVTQGSVSFSNYFWTHIFNGATIKDAFELTKEALKYTTAYQNPLLDANGNGVANETEDLTLIQNAYIGNGTLTQGSAPVIASVSPAQTLNNTSSAILSAEGVTDADGIARVWAVIRPPDYNQGGSSSPVQNLPSVGLMPVGNDRYEATYNGFTITGTYQIAIYARDRIGNTSIPKVTTVSVTNPLSRKAIIVAGGSQNDEMWPAIEKGASLAYDALKFQGYRDDDVYFMSPVIFSVGVDGAATISNLNYAVTTWAANNTMDLVLYLIGNGGNGTFQISASETLNATDLKLWLDTLQNTISGKVTVIYDAPQSGSFLPVLVPPSGKQRIVISSAGSAQTANFLSSGDISFSKYFWSRVSNGMNIRDAYLYGKKAMSFLSANQVAYLDDNGNGVGNEKTDGQQALNYALGFGITLGADDPMIGSVSPSQTLTGTPSALIWAKDVTTTGTIAKVWAVITPPGAGQNPNIPVMDLPTIDLIYNASANRYEGTYYRFNTQGDYSIAIYARDDEGNISLPSITIVTQTTTLDPYEDDNSPARASVIVLNDTAPQTHNFHAPGDEDWVKFYALSGLIYEIKADNAGTNADVVLEMYDTDGMTKLITADDGAAGEGELITWTAPKTGIYYVRVKNYDPNVYGIGTNYDLKVYRPTAPDIGTIRGIIISDGDLARITSATIQAGLGSALSEDGSFTLKVEAGTVNLSVNAEGYNSSTVQNVVVQTSQETPVTISMVPLGSDLNVTAMAGQNGTISCTPNPVNYGGSSTCTVNPAIGYKVDAFTVNGNPATLTNNQYIFTNVTANQTANVTFKSIIPYGDVNNDGSVDIVDAILALRIISKIPLPPSVSIPIHADVNRDGRIGMAEVIYILQQVAGIR